MRTKALLLTAALSAVGVASSMAQTAVYSVNIVGYINKTIPHGGSTLANQLNASGNNNTVANLLPAPPAAMTVFKFNKSNGSYEQAFFDDLADPAPAWTVNPGMTLNPGEGVFIDNTGGDYAVTFVGEVSLNNNISITSGFNALASAVPLAGQLVGTAPMSFPLPAVDSGDSLTVFRFRNNTYVQYFYDGLADPAPAWQPSPQHPGETVPSVDIGEGFFIDYSGTPPLSWVQTLSVGP